MRLALLVPHLAGLRLDQIISSDDRVVLVVAGVGRTARCPLCRRPAHRVHSTYHRTVADAPWGRRPAILRLRVRRFRCDTAACPRRIFAERFPNVVGERARRTDEHRALLEDVALALGGTPGARLAAKLGAPVSRNTLLRLLRAIPDEATATPRILGVDDWSLRRGRTYATILVDLERRRPIDLLPDRSADTLAGWLARHPGVEIVSRDRAGVYADGARRGAPDAIQVADRYHLSANAGETLERLLIRQHAKLRAAATAVAAEEAAVAPPTDLTPPAPRPPSRRDEEAAGRRSRRQARYDAVRALRREGRSIRAIGDRLGMSRTTVMKYLRADTCPMPGPRPNRRSLVDAWVPYLRARWAEGRRDATGLFREIKALGFPGGRSIVCARLTRWRAEERRPGPYPDAAPVDVAALPPEPPPVRDRSPRRTRWLLLTEPAKRSPDQAAFCERLLADCPVVARGVELALGFRRLVRERDHAGLAPWLDQARRSGLAEFRAFAAGVERDRAAVEAALELAVSNGQTEGQITKLKLLKRATYGRASLTLLRARLLRAS